MSAPDLITALERALSFSFGMTWEITWALVLGFALSAAVQSVVSKSEMTRLLPDDSPRTLALASLLGAASSSCSYAAVALARSLFRKGANFTAAMAFELASTNLVLELGLILALLMGWQFTLAEFVGGGLMILALAVLFRLFLKPALVEEARRQAELNRQGSMEGHAAMDMALTEGPVLRRLFSRRGLDAVSHAFVMDWAAVWRDILAGLLVAGALAAWVPHTFWTGFFLTDDPTLARIWGPLVGPLIAVVSFVCSIGNVPLAAVLWNGGLSFGGVVAFIFADLIVLPILNIYRKYYGRKMAAFLGLTFYAAMAFAAYVVEFAFGALGLVPTGRHAAVVEAGVSLDYKTVLNVLFLVLAALLVARFLRAGGRGALRLMNAMPVSGTAVEGGKGDHQAHHAPHS